MKRADHDHTFRIEHYGPWRVLFAMATEQEYGRCLRSLIDPLITGVGPVESAVSLSLTLAKLETVQNRPNLVVSLGSAGSQSLRHAEVYQITEVSYRDMDASLLGFERGRTPFLDLPRVLQLPMRIPGMPEASLSTGANVVSGNAFDTIAADMVDMESYSSFRACQAHGLPMIGLRGVSDGRRELERLADWSDSLVEVDRNLALAVGTLGVSLISGALGSPAGEREPCRMH